MKYVISKSILEGVPEIVISPDESSALRAAREVLTNAFAVEEKYDIVLANLLDLEKELLGLAAAEIVRRLLDYSDFYATRSILNVRLVNLLTAVKLYLDQLPQHVARCLPADKETKQTIRSYCSDEYDAHFEYRFMEALRNYVQHRGVPVHTTRHGGAWTSLGADGFLEYYVDIGVQRVYLEEDGKFKRSVLKEISRDVVDLKGSVRKYVECISTINDRTRKLIAESVKGARANVESAHHRYGAIYEGSLVGLSALAVGTNNEVGGSVPLLLEWDDIRMELQQRNPRLQNLARQYVTGIARIEKGEGSKS